MCSDAATEDLRNCAAEGNYAGLTPVLLCSTGCGGLLGWRYTKGLHLGYILELTTPHLPQLLHALDRGAYTAKPAAKRARTDSDAGLGAHLPLRLPVIAAQHYCIILDE